MERLRHHERRVKVRSLKKKDPDDLIFSGKSKEKGRGGWEEKPKQGGGWATGKGTVKNRHRLRKNWARNQNRIKISTLGRKKKR